MDTVSAVLVRQLSVVGFSVLIAAPACAPIYDLPDENQGAAGSRSGGALATSVRAARTEGSSPDDAAATSGSVAVSLAADGTCESEEDCQGYQALRVCDTEAGLCVECLPASDTCGAGLYCSDDMRCLVGCVDDTDCTGDLTCDAETHNCVGWSDDELCPPGTQPHEATRSCLPGCSDATPCPEGWACCTDRCRNLAVDEEHCGECDSACTYPHAAPQCFEGLCRRGECEEGYADCDPDADGCETDTQVDNDHCGACDTTCVSPGVCVFGVCEIPECGGGFADCDSDPADCETNISRRVDHCGACQDPCSDSNGTPTCSEGECSIQCDASWGDCNSNARLDGCETNLATTTSHCGACDRRCSDDHGAVACVEGVCTPECEPGFADCDGDATNGCEQDIASNSAHCGACSESCNLPHVAEAFCEEGDCGILACDEGRTDCDDDATNGCEASLLDDPLNCGRCGNPCTNDHGGTGCIGSVCAPTCDPGWANCDGSLPNGCETSLSLATSCGSCTTDCTDDYPHATGLCTTGSGAPLCGMGSCDDGWADCTSSAGCETDVLTSVHHCGGCEDVCDDTHGIADCVDASCVIVCDEGWGDCDEDPRTNGCEHDVTEDPDNCGACDNVCGGSTPYCTDGECVDFLSISVVNANTTGVSDTLGARKLTLTHSLETPQSASGAAANRAVVVVVASEGNAESDAVPQTITYATRAMTQVPGAALYNDNVWSGIYYMIEGATTGLPEGAGDYPLEITATANNQVLTAAVIELTGVSQTATADSIFTRYSSNCSNGLPSATVTTSSELAFAVDVVAAKDLGSAGFPVQIGQTAILDHGETPAGVGLASYKVGVTPIGSTLFGWSGVTCASWVHVGASFSRASSP